MAIELIYPELSYQLTGVFFEVHNELGRYSREKQYCDLLEKKFEQARIPYSREYVVGQTGNRIDFYIPLKIVIECKAKDIVTREDYYQMQRYLHILDIQLGFLVNFRQPYLRPKRVIKTKINRDFNQH